jgi:predicted ABC-type ATPase
MKSLVQILEEEVFPVGTKRTWKNGEFIKVAPGQWLTASQMAKHLPSEIASDFHNPQTALASSAAPLPKVEWIEKVEGLPEQTIDLHKKEGIYTPVRAALHKRILKGYLDQAKPVPEGQKPTVLMMMGITASGKSTARSQIALPEMEEYGSVVVDPDALKEAIPEYRLGLQKRAKNAAWMAHEESSDLADELLERASKERKNIVLDGTGKNLKTMQNRISAMKAKGFHVVLLMPHLNVEEAKKRAAKRAERTGRHVPSEIIDLADSKVAPNFLKLFKQADEATLVSNEGSAPKKLLSYQAGQAPEVHDTEGMEAFLKYAQHRGAKGTLDEAMNKKTEKKTGRSGKDSMMEIAGEIYQEEQKQMKGDGQKRKSSEQLPWPLKD